MRDIQKALIEISNIKNQMAAGTMFRGFGPRVIAITGLVAFSLAMVQHIWPDHYATNPTVLLFYWVLAALLCIGLVGTEMVARSRRHHYGIADKMIWNAVEQFMPAGVAGAAIGAVIWQFTPENLWLLPGLWSVLVALGIFTALRSLPQTIALVGAWYFLAGIAALILAAQFKTLTPFYMGIPFGVGQLLMAYLLFIADGEFDDEEE